ncbi:MAG: PAS domain S-box protein [Dehalococcoidia bacterium]|nr:MAG: PAS domain S-box protein [Dehalococcoidia bacterium]
MRKTGIDVVGDVPWGTNLCLFYETTRDLLEILVPYFKAGLRHNEFCMWVTSEPMPVEAAKAALRKAVRNLDDYINKGQIEILDASEWYTKSGKFHPDMVLDGWVNKENEAVKRGFEGLRVAGDTFWLEERQWREFIEYEAEIDNVIGNYRMIAICTYSLHKCGASEIIDVVDNHRYALIRREGKWETIQSAQRREAEEALRASVEFNSSLLRNSSNPILVINPDTSIVYVNPALEKLTGCSSAELVGRKPPYPWWTEETTQKTVEQLQDAMCRGTKRREEVFQNSKGRRFWVEITSTPVRGAEGLRYCLANWVDITERKRVAQELARYRQHLEEQVEKRTRQIAKANEQLQQLYQQEKALREQLEEEMKRRIEFTSALAHELKTPLTPVVMSSQTLTSQLKDETLLRVAKNIERGAANLNSRIDELLDLARGEIGMLQIKPEQVDVLQLIREVVDDVAPVRASREQSLVLKLPPSLPPVWADRVRLRQIVLNLLSNAFKFTPAGGKITLRARQEDGNLVVEVKDTGSGIAEEDRQRIFNPYHRKESDMERLSGLGLGLALCKTLVELHKGRIWIKSRAGRGSTFGFSLPVGGPQSAASPEGQALTSES